MDTRITELLEEMKKAIDEIKGGMASNVDSDV